MRIVAPTRKQDRHGSGEFGASRGSRRHNGVDKACYPGSIVLAVSAGEVTKLGYPYGDDLSFRYVQVTDAAGNDVRYFYVEPSVHVGQQVAAGDELGVSQPLGDRYEGITEHVHLEVKRGGDYVDPIDYLARHCTTG